MKTGNTKTMTVYVIKDAEGMELWPSWNIKSKHLALQWARDLRRARPELKPVCVVKVHISVVVVA